MSSLRRVAAGDVGALRRDPVDPAILVQAAMIVHDVRARGEAALREHGERLGDLAPGGPLVFGRDALAAALRDLPAEQQDLLRRTRDRIAAFATAQRHAIQPTDTAIEGGRAGQQLAPVQSAACYAPGGRYPLPSSSTLR